jgi:hypothetical protein
MPEISRFFGIVIRMYFDDHNPPHIHAFYAGNEAKSESSRSRFSRARFRIVRRRWFSNGQHFINAS